jgi:hypothetical protein
MKIVKLSMANTALLISLLGSHAFAGTGQMFSPSGLPQGGTQTYTPPTPGNIPTVTFPTPPLPLGESILQGFPGASVPLGEQAQQSTSVNNGLNQSRSLPQSSQAQPQFSQSETSQSQLSQSQTSQSQVSQPQLSKLQSSQVQVSPGANNSIRQSPANTDLSTQLRGELHQTQPALPAQRNQNNNPTVGLAQIGTRTGSIESFFQCPPTVASAQKDRKSTPLRSSGRLIWHVMDNIGIPVPTGSEEDLDPSLKQPYVMPLPKMLKEPKYPSNPQKIPESELEGTDDSSEQPHPSQPH